jgi:hypothetical protein
LVGHEGHNELPFKEADIELTSDEFPPLKSDDSVLEGLGQSSPKCSMKEPNSSDLWTEVVRKRRKKAKSRSRCDKIVSNEMGVLEY